MSIIQAIKSIWHKPCCSEEFDLDYDKAHAEKRLNESYERMCDVLDDALETVKAPRRHECRNGHSR